MSQLFEPFRAIGYVCDQTPAALQQRGTETFVAVAVGRAYQLYSCDRLNLLFVGPMLRDRIRALAQLGDLTFAACGADVSVCRRGKEVATYAGRDAGRVSLLLVLGTHLLAISKGGTVNVWEVPGYRTEMSPFGGIKDSGLGYKEGVVEAMKSYTNVKTFSLPWGV